MSWTSKRLVIAAAFIFAAHVFAIFTLQTRKPILSRIATTGSPRVYFPSPTSTLSPGELDGLNDPLAFASANPRGFSGAAWMNRPQMDYAPSNATPPPQFLSFRRSELGSPARPLAEVSRIGSLPFISLALPKPEHRSTLTLEGDLAARPLITTLPALPIQVATEVLSNTVVQLGVQADGYPFSARIITGSGSHAADLAALQIAQKIRFAPNRNKSDLQWGELTFQWFTAEPPSTNNPANPPLK